MFQLCSPATGVRFPSFHFCLERPRTLFGRRTSTDQPHHKPRLLCLMGFLTGNALHLQQSSCTGTPMEQGHNARLVFRHKTLLWLCCPKPRHSQHVQARKSSNRLQHSTHPANPPTNRHSACFQRSLRPSQSSSWSNSQSATSQRTKVPCQHNRPVCAVAVLVVQHGWCVQCPMIRLACEWHRPSSSSF